MSPLEKNRTLQTFMKVIDMKCLYPTMSTHDSWLWDHRFYHYIFRSLTPLYHKELVLGMSKIISCKKGCEICLVGKQPKNYFKSHVAHKSFGMLDVIH